MTLRILLALQPTELVSIGSEVIYVSLVSPACNPWLSTPSSKVGNLPQGVRTESKVLRYGLCNFSKVLATALGL